MLPCVNCKKDVDPDTAKFFGKIFICDDCYRIAERLYARGEQELKMLLLVLRESIRLAIVQGNLQFSLQQLEDMDKEDLLSHLQSIARNVREQKTKEEQCPTKMPTRTPSRETIKPPALPAGGKPRSD